MWIDANAHVRSDGTWFGRPSRSDPESLLRSMDAAGVDRAALVGLHGVNPPEEILDIATRHAGRFVPVVGFDPSWAEDPLHLRGRLGELRGEGVRGVKIHCRLSRLQPLEPRVLDALEACRDLDLAVLFCSHLHGLDPVAPSIVEVVERLVTHAPGARLLVMHAGLTRALDLFEVTRQFENLYLDVSFTIHRYAGSSMDADLAFLFDHLDRKIVVGSDYPEYGHTETLARFDDLARSIDPERRGRILARNVLRILEPEAVRDA